MAGRARPAADTPPASGPPVTSYISINRARHEYPSRSEACTRHEPRLLGCGHTMRRHRPGYQRRRGERRVPWSRAAREVVTKSQATRVRRHAKTRCGPATVKSRRGTAVFAPARERRRRRPDEENFQSSGCRWRSETERARAVGQSKPPPPRTTRSNSTVSSPKKHGVIHKAENYCIFLYITIFRRFDLLCTGCKLITRCTT